MFGERRSWSPLQKRQTDAHGEEGTKNKGFLQAAELSRSASASEAHAGRKPCPQWRKPEGAPQLTFMTLTVGCLSEAATPGAPISTQVALMTATGCKAYKVYGTDPRQPSSPVLMPMRASVGAAKHAVRPFQRIEGG